MALTEKTKAWIQKNADVDLTGKTVLITCANSGIGFKTVETMAYLGASFNDRNLFRRISQFQL